MEQNQKQENKLEAWQVALILLEEISRKVGFNPEQKKKLEVMEEK